MRNISHPAHLRSVPGCLSHKPESPAPPTASSASPAAVLASSQEPSAPQKQSSSPAVRQSCPAPHPSREKRTSPPCLPSFSPIQPAAVQSHSPSSRHLRPVTEQSPEHGYKKSLIPYTCI